MLSEALSTPQFSNTIGNTGLCHECFQRLFPYRNFLALPNITGNTGLYHGYSQRRFQYRNFLTPQAIQGYATDALRGAFHIAISQ